VSAPEKTSSIPLPGKTFQFKLFTPVFLAAVLFSTALMYVNAIAALLAFSALFYFMARSITNKQIVLAGFLFGLIASLVLNIWMITVITDYVKGSLFIGLLCYLAAALVMAVFFGVQFYLFSLFCLRQSRKFSLAHNAVLMACLWVVFEWIRAELFSALPWFSYSIGITFGRSLYFIQPAAFGGTWMLSFILIFSSYFIGYSFQAKRWKLLAIPFAVLMLQFATGIFMYKSIGEKINQENKSTFSVALIQPALSPETVWNDEHANELVERLFSLNAEAAKKKPDLIVWTETVVPWTFAADDDFLEEVFTITQPANSHTLIGMNSVMQTDAGELYNSAYFFDPAGKNFSRYDKQDLLTLVEKPLFNADGNIILPFMAASGVKMFPGKNDMPLLTPWGKAGVLLCNEGTGISQAKDRADNGAGFLVNMGNDNWFAGHYISLQHFYNCRLRAIETRKDIVINNNMGFAGVVRADGEIAAQSEADIVSVQFADIRPNTIPAKNTSIFVLITFILTVVTIINKVFIPKIKPTRDLIAKPKQ
jgi:apolipoprotein N-acyltransferase